MIRRAAAITTLVFGLSACAGTDFKWDNARQIKAGMTEADVTAIMGRPYLVQSTSGGVKWVWAQGNALGQSKSVSVVFVDGKVVEPPPIPDSFH